MTPNTISPFDFLNQVPELQGLPKPDLNILLSKATLLEFENGETIFRKGDKADFFYYVIEGKVILGSCSPSGLESANCIAGRKNMFCCLPTLDMNPYPVSATSVGRAKVMRIHIKTFHEICLRYPAIYQKFVAAICSNMRALEQRHSERTASATSRIASLLIGASGKTKEPIHFTRAEIAKLVGITVETAIRILSRLTKEKIIQSTRGVIKIIDDDKLYVLSELAPPRSEP